MKPIPEGWNTREIGAKSVDWYALAHDQVRYVGEAVAVVVAEDKYTARKAAELIEVDYEELPVVADPRRGWQPGAPLVEPSWGNNLVIDRDFGAATWRALRRRRRRDQGCRLDAALPASPMEPRGYGREL